MPGFLHKFLLQPWWRLTRAQTLGVRGVVHDGAGNVLLVRHSYTPGWHFPGGGVETSQTALQALERELLEEAAVRLTGPPVLFGLYANFACFPRDHVAVYVVTAFERGEWKKSAEILEARMFPLDALPDGLSRGTGRRMEEIFKGATPTPIW